MGELAAIGDLGFAQAFADVGFAKPRSDSATYDMLDKFGRCEIMVSYVHDELGMQSGFNAVEVVVSVNVIDPAESLHEMLGENAVCIIGRLHTTAGEGTSFSSDFLNV
jgi:hypothetical protein